MLDLLTIYYYCCYLEKIKQLGAWREMVHGLCSFSISITHRIQIPQTHIKIVESGIGLQTQYWGAEPGWHWMLTGQLEQRNLQDPRQIENLTHNVDNERRWQMPTVSLHACTYGCTCTETCKRAFIPTTDTKQYPNQWLTIVLWFNIFFN